MAEGTIINLEALVEQAQLGVIDGLNQAAVEFMAALASELPPGAAAQSITIRPTTEQGGKYVVSVGIEDEGVLKYIWAYWKGEPTTITITAHQKVMKFDRWTNGPADLRSPDGHYYFPQVQHTYLPHDFVERAIAKFDSLVPIISNKLAQRLNK